MKQILLFIILFSNLMGNSQPLTYGQAFNFDVGDVIQGFLSSSQNFGPPSSAFRTSVILNKVFTPNNDSIIYTIQRTHYTPPACQTCQPSTSTATITQIVTNLNTAIPNANSTTCYPTGDTLYVDHCNRKTYKIYPLTAGILCIEPDTETSFYIEGIGYFYTKFKEIAPAYLESFYLTYYLKQSGPCGNALDVSINEQSNDLVLTALYPNPAKEIIQIESKENLFYYDIYDLNGKRCKSDFITNNQITISDLPNGLYITNIYSSDYKIKTAKIIRE